MEELGYDISWQVFNSKYHGVPQNRERVYTLGHLRRCGERKVFPLKGTDGEDSVQRKINIIGHRDGYRRNTQTFDYNGITEALDTATGGGREMHTAIPMCIDPQGRTSKEVKPSDTAPTLRAQAHGNNPEICIPVLTPDRAEKRQNGRRFKDNGEEAFTLTAQDKHGVALKIREATVKGYAEAEIGDSVNLSMPDSKTRRGRVGKKQANTLDTSCEQGVVVPVIWYEKYKCYIAIRKLTPKECWRLQGWTDDYFEKAQFVNSDSQLYKQAGNGVTVNVVEDIGKAIARSERISNARSSHQGQAAQS